MKTLLTYFAKANKIAGKNKVLPIMDNCKIENGWLTVTNLEIFYSFEVPTQFKGLVPFKMLHEYVKKNKLFPALADLGNDKAIMGQVTFKPETFEDFPLGNHIENKDLKQGCFEQSDIEAIQNVSTFCGNDDMRPTMKGVVINCYPDKTECGATDAHKLKYLPLSDKTKEIAGIMRKLATTMIFEGIVKQDNSHLEITGLNERIVIRLIDARFPDYHCVLPVDYAQSFKINRIELLNMVKGMVPFCNPTTLKLDLSIKPNSLLLEAQDVDRDVSINNELTLQYLKTGEDLDISVNGKFLIMLLESFSEDVITFEYSDSNKPVLINKNGLIMPIMRY